LKYYLSDSKAISRISSRSELVAPSPFPKQTFLHDKKMKNHMDPRRQALSAAEPERMTLLTKFENSNKQMKIGKDDKL
jgi:hypothetical protein